MANKQTKEIRKAVKSAGHAGQSSFTYQAPVEDYFNHEGAVMKPRSIPTARVGKDGIVSSNPQRNTCMKVLHNTGVKGKASLTVHEALEKGASVINKNHKYIEYRTPGGR